MLMAANGIRFSLQTRSTIKIFALQFLRRTAREIPLRASGKCGLDSWGCGQHVQNLNPTRGLIWLLQHDGRPAAEWEDLKSSESTTELLDLHAFIILPL